MTQQIPILEAFKRIDFGHGPIPSDQTLAELLRPGCSQDSKLIEMGEGEDWEPSKRESQRVLRHYNNEAVAGLNLKKFGSLAEPFIEILAELYMIASVRGCPASLVVHTMAEALYFFILIPGLSTNIKKRSGTTSDLIAAFRRSQMGQVFEVGKKVEADREVTKNWLKSFVR
jgi:hypothetical protein